MSAITIREPNAFFPSVLTFFGIGRRRRHRSNLVGNDVVGYRLVSGYGGRISSFRDVRHGLKLLPRVSGLRSGER